MSWFRERLGLEFPIIQDEGFIQEKQAPVEDDEETETSTDSVDTSDVEEEEEQPCCDNLTSNTVEIVHDSSSTSSDNKVPISSETETIKGNKK